MRAFVVAGTQSGVGKTSISVGLIATLRRRGLDVRPFKVGPDFIDPGHHALAAGRPSRNLDGWILSREANLEAFARGAAGGDVAVVEGVMGLFDGCDGRSERGSTAEIAKWLGAPVVLVVDAWALSRSAAALVHGYATFDPDLRLAGVVFNRVATRDHARWLTEAVESATPVLGAVPADDGVRLPERHLGLTTVDDDRHADERIERLSSLIEENVDVDSLLGEVSVPEPPPVSTRPPRKSSVRFAIARDAAFCFYYEDNLDLLRESGAELVEFSPIHGRLPAGCDAVYLGGGYPELHAESLAANSAARHDIREFARTGGLVYAECGGLMYLGASIEDPSSRWFPMAGVLPFATRLASRPRLAYAEVEFRGDRGPFPRATARGHLFHQSEIVGEAPSERCYEVRPSTGARFLEGFRTRNVLASYVHLHFASNPEFPRALVDFAGRG